MPDRYEALRDDLVKSGISYEEAQKAKEPIPVIADIGTAKEKKSKKQK